MHSELILALLGAIIVICFWRVALAILLAVMVGLLLIGVVTAIGLA